MQQLKLSIFLKCQYSYKEYQTKYFFFVTLLQLDSKGMKEIEGREIKEA